MYTSLRCKKEEPPMPNWLSDGNEWAGPELLAVLDLSS